MLMYIKIKILFDFGENINKLPKGITHLIINCNQSSSLNNLPNSLTHLSLKYDFNQKIDNVPFKLKVVKLINCRFEKK